jgi:hypothetical protein
MEDKLAAPLFQKKDMQKDSNQIWAIWSCYPLAEHVPAFVSMYPNKIKLSID